MIATGENEGVETDRSAGKPESKVRFLPVSYYDAVQMVASNPLPMPTSTRLSLFFCHTVRR